MSPGQHEEKEPVPSSEGRLDGLVKSTGVEQIEALSASISTWTRAWIFASIFLVAYAFRLDSLVRRTVSSAARAQVELM